jgi:hypothetical protein
MTVSQDPDPAQIAYEREKWTYEMAREDAKRAHDAAKEFTHSLNVAAIDSGTTAVKTALLINGGATVALLGFIGALASKDKVTFTQITPLAHNLMWFAYGVASAATATAFAYFTNYFTAAVTTSKVFIWTHPYVSSGPRTKLFTYLTAGSHILSVLSAIISLVLFIMGMNAVGNSVAHLAGGS